jgi:hypothetical protein
MQVEYKSYVHHHLYYLRINYNNTHDGWMYVYLEVVRIDVFLASVVQVMTYVRFVCYLLWGSTRTRTFLMFRITGTDIITTGHEYGHRHEHGYEYGICSDEVLLV